MQTASVSSPNIRVGYLVATLGCAKTDALDMEFWITQRHIDQMCSIAGSPCLTHAREGAMAGESALQNKALPVCKQEAAAHHGLTGGRDRCAEWLFGIKGPGNGVWIDNARRALESESTRLGCSYPSHWDQRPKSELPPYVAFDASSRSTIRCDSLGCVGSRRISKRLPSGHSSTQRPAASTKTTG